MNRYAIALVSSLAPVAALASLYGDIPDAKHAWAVHDDNRPFPSRVTLDAKGVPSDAIVLLDGTKESYEKNWCDAEGNAAHWIWNDDGSISCGTNFSYKECRTRESFGDCQLHIEYRHPADCTALKTFPTFDGRDDNQMRGNSGVFLMGSAYGYEVQVLESYYSCRELEGKPEYVPNYADGIAGSVYAENPPSVNPQKKPGEWQVYDIVFHQPIWKDGVLLHPGSVTIFFNGVLVQDHWEMEGQTTHVRRRPLAPHPTKGPLALQDHGCEVYYRNIWLRPIPSRWDNLTHSAMSADPAEVMKLRRETAAKLYAKIADTSAATAANVLALGEVLAYSNEARYANEFWTALTAYKASKPTDARELGNLNKRLQALVRAGIIAAEDVPAVPEKN